VASTSFGSTAGPAPASPLSLVRLPALLPTINVLEPVSSSPEARATAAVPPDSSLLLPSS